MNDYLVDYFLCHLRDLTDPYINEEKNRVEALEYVNHLFCLKENICILKKIINNHFLRVLDKLTVSSKVRIEAPTITIKPKEYPYTEMEKTNMRVSYTPYTRTVSPLHTLVITYVPHTYFCTSHLLSLKLKPSCPPNSGQVILPCFLFPPS